MSQGIPPGGIESPLLYDAPQIVLPTSACSSGNSVTGLITRYNGFDAGPQDTFAVNESTSRDEHRVKRALHKQISEPKFTRGDQAMQRGTLLGEHVAVVCKHPNIYCANKNNTSKQRSKLS